MRLKKVVKHKNTLILIGIYLFGIALFSILIHTVVRLAGSDDIVFQKQISPYANVFDWVNYRYHSWSGRIFAESFVYIFSPLPILFWKIAETLLFVLFDGFIFLYYLVFTKARSPFKDRVMMILAVTLPALFDSGVILTGQLWVTGSMNYFWLSTFTLIALYPVVFYAVHKKGPKNIFIIIGFISTVIAACSQEQGGLILTAIMVLLTSYLVYLKSSKKLIRIPFLPIGFSITSTIFLIFGLIAPGNKARIGSETITWRPDFYTIAFNKHIEYAGRWFIDAVVNHSGFLLIAFWVLVILLLIKKKTKNKVNVTYATLFVLGAASIISLSKGFDSVNPLVTFYPTWKPNIPHHIISLLLLIPWCIILIVSLIAPYIIYGFRSKKAVILSVLISGFLCSILIITLSPTMYASGPRTLYFPSVTILFVIYILFDDFISLYKKQAVVFFVFLVCCLACAQYYKLITQLLSIN